MEFNSRLRTIRLRNLSTEIKKRREAGEKKIHEKLGISSSRLSQLINGHQPITNQMARKIEQSLQLETHSLDAQLIRAYIFLSFNKFHFETGKVSTHLRELICQINEDWEERTKPVVRLDYLIGEWDAVLEVRCLHLEQIKEIVATINNNEKTAVDKSNSLITFGDRENFIDTFPGE